MQVKITSKRAWVLVLAAGLCFLSLSPLTSQLSGEALANKIISNLKQASEDTAQFTVDARILSKQSSGEERNNSLRLYVKIEEGTQSSLAKVLSPEANRGEIYLNNKGKYWSYYPKIKRSIVLSPLSTLLGDVSVGDILAPPHLHLYNVKVLKSEGNEVSIELTKKSNSAPYSRIVQYYKGETLQTAEFYSGSQGKILMKKAEYQRPESIRNSVIYGQVKILNMLQQGNYSIIAMRNPSEAQIPNSWFNPNNLEQVP